MSVAVDILQSVLCLYVLYAVWRGLKIIERQDRELEMKKMEMAKKWEELVKEDSE